jgi:hypothetical protein
MKASIQTGNIGLTPIRRLAAPKLTSAHPTMRWENFIDDSLNVSWQCGCLRNLRNYAPPFDTR